MRRARVRRRHRDGAGHEATAVPASTPRSIHALQRLQATIGNRAVARLLEGTVPVDPSSRTAVVPGTAVPPRPSEPDVDLKALHDAAEAAAGVMKSLGYQAFKENVIAAGGYGDILNIFLDQRFNKKYYQWALQFSDAVDEYGAEALGLEEVEGSPASADPGTVLVLNGPTHGISETYGDISVIDGVAGKNKDLLRSYNDGTLLVPVKDVHAMVRGMYRPIVRPELKAE